MLDKHLDSNEDPSIAIRAVYGQWLPWLHFLDPTGSKRTRPDFSQAKKLGGTFVIPHGRPILSPAGLGREVGALVASEPECFSAAGSRAGPTSATNLRVALLPIFG